ncbi:uncharacterized protein LOC112684847 [Sipha flava]|uniref:Uncharacterized protein LOC112684847 n=1 Tax=Sipha flava TaxID=143950 RepID=A0A8B8FNS8_9HEMI|nr:uncharacterized protein LOC112684847 [Sipha flava]XP_025412338.1 uncharacterized protein LOC112684847 [Sipha flava]
MERYYNIDIDKLISDHKLSYENECENVTNQLKQLYNNRIKLYAQKIDENYKISKQLSDVNTKISEGRNKNRFLTEKIKSEQDIVQAEFNRSESINNECRLLEAEEDKLKDMIDTSKGQLTKILKEKKGLVKKIKREINSFKSGVNMYEKFLQLSMSIENHESNSIIKIIMKNNPLYYNIILEENDNDFKLINIIPHNQHIGKAVALYNQNKDIQGLLAYLYQT